MVELERGRENLNKAERLEINSTGSQCFWEKSWIRLHSFAGSLVSEEHKLERIVSLPFYIESFPIIQRL